MENKKAEELLPLGSIVLLNNGEKKLMIVGRYAVKNDTNEVFDYLGCLYPEGIMNADVNFLFNDNDINNVIFRGFTNEEDVEFKAELGALLNNRKKES